jgi:flagellar M-ring protein FliF
LDKNKTIEDILEGMKSLNEKISTRNKILIGVIAGIILIGALCAAYFMNKTEYSTILTGLTQDDITTVAAELQSEQIPFKVEGDRILVDKNQEAEVMAKLAAEGYPKNGFAYGVFTDNVSLMTTDYEKKSYMTFDLQNRLAATIRLFDGVKNAVVTIALSDEQTYVLQSDVKEPSASVVVIMNNGGSPTAKQVESIKSLVAKSLPGMSTDQVAVLDGNGEEIFGSSSDDNSDLTKLRFELERILESSIKTKVLNVIEPLFGKGKVSVSVKSSIDINKKISELTNYSPSENSANTGVTSHQGLAYEGAGVSSAASGVPGTETNSDVPVYTEKDTTNSNNNLARREETYDYLVSQFKEQVQSGSGQTTDVNVSVVIDSDALPDTTRLELKQLVANASGIAVADMDNKISVFAMPFSTTASEGDNVGFSFVFRPWMYIVLGVLLLLLIIFITMLLQNKKLKKTMSDMEEDYEDTLATMKAAVIDTNTDDAFADGGAESIVVDAPIELGGANIKKVKVDEEVRKFVEENPEIAANRIRDWLNGVE